MSKSKKTKEQLKMSSKKHTHHELSAADKAKLWNAFDTEMGHANKTPLECIFSTSATRDTCVQCQSMLAFSDEGFLTCTNNKCGIIYRDLLDYSPEWRYYGADDNHQQSDPTRCGLPINPLLEQSSFGCQFVNVGRTTHEVRKIRRYTEWQTMSYKEKALYEEFMHIATFASHAGISKKIIDDAMRYHKKISEYEQTFRGDNKDGLLAASIYVSCRINNCPRTPKELAAIFHLNVADTTHGCKKAQSILNILEKDMEQNDKTLFCKIKPEDFIERYCSKLCLSGELTKLCQFIAIKIEKENLMPENTPDSIAAGIVYFIAQLCNVNISKRDVKNVSEKSEVTINKCFKKMERMTEQLVPTVFLTRFNK